MDQIDLDDLPPRVARTLASLVEGAELTLVQGGAVVGRLRVASAKLPESPSTDLPPEQGMREVMEQFKAMIDDEF